MVLQKVIIHSTERIEYKGEAVNVNAKSLNAMFETLLVNFEYKKEYKARLGKLITEGLKIMFEESIQENTKIKKNLSIIRVQLEKIEERYALGEIPLQIFERLSNKYSVEIEEAEQLLTENSFDSSNLEKVVEKGLEIIANISRSWACGDYDEKQRLQKLVFPEGIKYDKKNNTVRTLRVNSLFAAIPHLTQVLEENKKGNHTHDYLFSSYVPRTGFEPAHDCSRCDLNTVRLPISPPGHSGLQI
jgi:site-specific DNA recombinase